MSQKEKDKVMSTSRAQSIVSSRKSSRRSSFDMDLPEGIEVTKDEKTGLKSVQVGTNQGEHARDDDTIANDPGMFAAEKTWPTDDELRIAAS